MSDLVAECLTVRQWMLPLLSRSVTATFAVQHWPPVSLEAFRLFLANEACAAPLLARLGDAAGRMPAAERAALGDAALLELQRIMSARAQIAAIDVMAGRAGVRPVLLKGGIAATNGGAGFDLGDIDLLLDAASVPLLGTALVSDGGYRRDPYHELFTLKGSLPVELHTSLDVGYATAPLGGSSGEAIPGFAHVRRLTAYSHVMYCLQHSTTKHASRRGHLRDVLLIADALDACTPAERTAAETAIQPSPAREVYTRTLRLANAVRISGDGTGAEAVAPQRTGANTRQTPDDSFERMAACKYAVSVWWPHGPGRHRPGLVDQMADFVASPGDAWRQIAGYLRTRDDEHSRWYSPRVARISRWLARVLATVLRVTYRTLSLAYSFAAAMVFAINYRIRWRGRGSVRGDRALDQPA